MRELSFSVGNGETENGKTERAERALRGSLWSWVVQVALEKRVLGGVGDVLIDPGLDPGPEIFLPSGHFGCPLSFYIEEMSLGTICRPGSMWWAREFPDFGIGAVLMEGASLSSGNTHQMLGGEGHHVCSLLSHVQEKLHTHRHTHTQIHRYIHRDTHTQVHT